MSGFSRRRLGTVAAVVAVVLSSTAVFAAPAGAVTGDASTNGSGAVVKLGNTSGACSGVLVSAQWVLTSATCFPNATPYAPPAEATTATLGRANLATGTDGHVVAVAELIPQPGRPITLARLATPVPDVLTASLATTPPQAGDSVFIAGYGRTAAEWVPDQIHYATVTVDTVDATTLAISSTTGPTTCKGDAGGPAWRTTAAGDELLGLHDSSWQGGCLGESETRTGATEIRVDDLHDALTQQITSPILARYLDLGGAASFLGAPVGGEYAIAGGTGQDYEHGAIYYSPATGSHFMEGPILAHYLELGGPAALGFPYVDETPTADTIGRYNHFNRPDGVSIYWSPATGAHEVQGAIRDKWIELGWETVVGYPLTDETTAADGVGRYNDFSNVSIYYTPETGAHEILGDIRAKWQELGGVNAFGYPITDELTTPDGVGRYNHFSSNTSIYWTPATGAHLIGGAIRDTWASLGWENSPLGYPISDEYDIPGGRRNDFQHGNITWNASNGTTQVAII